MSKDWKRGRNCEFVVDTTNVKVGTKAWVFTVGKEDVTFLTKKDQTPSLQKVTLSVEEAETCVAVKPGKPRSDFESLFSESQTSTPAKNPLVDSILKAALENSKNVV